MQNHITQIDGEIQYSNVSCDEIFDLVNWKDAKVIGSLLVLAIINVAVIVGNCLVIAAVFMSTKLRTVTNLFIVSLACADLMVGLAVLPFSATWEIFQIWIFGELWCSMWLAVDVWMCTASILNLCAISMDRYVAVTRPVTYPSIMSSRRAKLLIATVWILSFVICFPPLVGWNDRKRTFFRQLISNSSSVEHETLVNQEVILDENGLQHKYQIEECTYTCELTNEKGYVVYSAIGSFFLPMFVMLFFYWKIYRAAVETTRAINQGFRTTKGSRLLGNRFEEQRLTLRIHRGRSVQNYQNSASGPTSPNPQINGKCTTDSPGRLSRSRSHERIKVHLTPPPRVGKRATSYRPRINNFNASNYSPNSRRPMLSPSPGSSPTCRPLDSLTLPVSDGSRRHRRGSESETSTPSPSPTHCASGKYETLSSSSAEEHKPKFISKMGKRNIKAQVKRFRMETKAAKTLGIIVGGFIVCWLPFFIMYVWRAFCEKCIPPLLFSVFFWLGYCNSFMNPILYSVFNRDFRWAFKKIICRCVCKREKKAQPQAIPIFLSSLGEDSEGNNDDHSHASSHRRDRELSVSDSR